MRKTIRATFILVVVLVIFVLSSCVHAPGGRPVDSDGDGVYDNFDYRYDLHFITEQFYDKCPETPLGVKVDKRGCPLDSDGDGIPDHLDKCPGTPSGLKVDKNGCPIDSDGDGVPDYLDKCPGTPAGTKVDKDGCPSPVVQRIVPQPESAAGGETTGAKTVEAAILEKGRVTLKVEFDFDKAVVKQQYHQEIGHLAEVMKKYPDLGILIEGYTDHTGEPEYNQNLSERRAEAVKRYLVENFGIESNRLSIRGYGETRPIASNATKEGRQKNRRVEAAAEYSIKK